jgi:hypothetical protein
MSLSLSTSSHLPHKGEYTSQDSVLLHLFHQNLISLHCEESNRNTLVHKVLACDSKQTFRIWIGKSEACGKS